MHIKIGNTAKIGVTRGECCLGKEVKEILCITCNNSTVLGSVNRYCGAARKEVYRLVSPGSVVSVVYTNETACKKGCSCALILGCVESNLAVASALGIGGATVFNLTLAGTIRNSQVTNSAVRVSGELISKICVYTLFTHESAIGQIWGKINV